MTSPPCLRSIELPLPPSFFLLLVQAPEADHDLYFASEERQKRRRVVLLLTGFVRLVLAGVSGRRDCYSLRVQCFPFYGFQTVCLTKHWFSGSIISRRSYSRQRLARMNTHAIELSFSQPKVLILHWKSGHTSAFKDPLHCLFLYSPFHQSHCTLGPNVEVIRFHVGVLEGWSREMYSKNEWSARDQSNNHHIKEKNTEENLG